MATVSADQIMADPAHSHTDWDTNASTYVSAYMVMVVGVLCAALAWKAYGRKGADLFSLEVHFSLFSLLEGLAFGFAGIAQQTIAHDHWQGILISRRPFAPHSEWLAAWALAMVAAPLASGCLLGALCAHARAASAWTRWAAILSVLVALVDLYLCAVSVDLAGRAAMAWGLAASLLALALSAPGGREATAMIVGCSVRAGAYLVLVFAPPGCWSSGNDCPFPAEFSQLAVFNSLSVVAIAFIYAGTAEKMRAAQPYLPALSGDGPRRCCGM
eukprot:CAMPEP_0176187858 /NCGR_PEP_ID=MMETSP0121_2-20121125/2616_1 /TAXON_ID=160619 /ORGANISM="Kryptoperidinium foliaceum, Strain CCMP 1326" /LENGTH=271 /DNA_ID=CAMNT_0017526415 /DNA_START=17 /DNA_END=832 /DNA_ORIENTATION=+